MSAISAYVVLLGFRRDWKGIPEGNCKIIKTYNFKTFSDLPPLSNI